MALQRAGALESRVVQRRLDGRKFKTQLPVEENLLEPVHLLAAVDSVTGLRYVVRGEQPESVVVAQGPGGHAGEG
ncbi:hypothetical protein SDC9_61291 [bioreactor metagenome]|uniref:Uncharacterized protein n=1 Tax=bioreactor metagenome TaxID=1076179 RepID=A0A644XGA0_9ZZZZ